ncbi:Chromatin remodeling complex subunit [Hibiscus syriacus]|uniref:Chromatin remodeling complex subunit n=1 Tax=Hibiscus syriacus TaxID=106335 RepID=A0A6A2XHZ2_HIBSY|nr:Chromatin remodeling complex subunit [Hibiscus syriacus]
MDDFKLKDCSERGATNGALWTEAETLLLDSVLKHRDDWDLFAQNVQTKSKLDCITKLIELPFGESLIYSAKGRGNSSSMSMNVNGIKSDPVHSSKRQKNIINEDQGYDGTNEIGNNGNCENQDPPLKKKRIASIPDAGNSLMKQVVRISTMVEPQITDAAAEAAVAMLSDEIAAVATGLGAAAARAKLLAMQEEREIEHLVATIIEAQLKKLHSNIRHCDDAEVLMEKEYAAIEELKEHILGERINILQMTYNTGTSKLLDHSSVQ